MTREGALPPPSHRRPLALWAPTTEVRGVRRFALSQPGQIPYACTGSTLH